jgi:hypothetical protein
MRPTSSSFSRVSVKALGLTTFLVLGLSACSRHPAVYAADARAWLLLLLCLLLQERTFRISQS